MNLVADQDIDWEMLQGRLQAQFRSVWSTMALRRKWIRLKSNVSDFQNKAHQGLLRIYMTLG